MTKGGQFIEKRLGKARTTIIAALGEKRGKSCGRMHEEEYGGFYLPRSKTAGKKCWDAREKMELIKGVVCTQSQWKKTGSDGKENVYRG